MKKILVTGCGGSATYNFVSSLRMAKEKFYIVGTDINKEHLELSNVNKKYVVSPVSDPSYIDIINKIIDLEKVTFIHPQPDIEVAFISRYREKFNAKTFLPSDSTIRLCQNKMLLNERLKSKNVSVPVAFKINSLDDLKNSLEEILTISEKAWLRAIKGAGSKASIPIKEAKHGEMWIDYWIKMRGLKLNDFMISEFLPGREFAFQSIWNDGKIITSQARERLEYAFGNLTVSGQSSSPSVARTVHDKRINDIATNAILAVDEKAKGIFCVDLKENISNIPCVTEINAGRFFTTNNFFSHAGANMPYLYIKMACGESLPKLTQYNAVQKDLFWLRMIDCGYKMVKAGNWSYEEI